MYFDETQMPRPIDVELEIEINRAEFLRLVEIGLDPFESDFKEKIEEMINDEVPYFSEELSNTLEIEVESTKTDDEYTTHIKIKFECWGGMDCSFDRIKE